MYVANNETQPLVQKPSFGVLSGEAQVNGDRQMRQYE